MTTWKIMIQSSMGEMLIHKIIKRLQNANWMDDVIWIVICGLVIRWIGDQRSWDQSIIFNWFFDNWFFTILNWFFLINQLFGTFLYWLYVNQSFIRLVRGIFYNFFYKLFGQNSTFWHFLVIKMSLNAIDLFLMWKLTNQIFDVWSFKYYVI